METIKNYLDNMFAGLPKSERVLELKNNILINMEEKYNELKSQGKSENEAIGIVISEFGNIDELVSELGIQKDSQENLKPIVTKEEVENYLIVKKAMGVKIGIGVFLCILAPAMLILITQLLDNGIITTGLTSDASDVLGLIPLFILIAIAVGIFIYSGLNFECYAYMEGGVQLPGNLEADLKQRYEAFTPIFRLKLIVSVCMLVLSPVSLFVSSLLGDTAEDYGVVVLLFIVAIAVYQLISSGTVKESYECLLEIGDYTEHYTKYQKKEDKVIGAVASIVWPLTVLVFLFCGFVYDLWHIAWIAFPIVGILFGMFCAAYSIITGKDE